MNQLNRPIIFIKAARAQYSRAKQLKWVRISLSFLLAMGFPILLSIQTNIPPSIKVIATAFVGIASFVLIYQENRFTKCAATIQDVFERKSHNLESNKFLIGKPPLVEEIHSLANECKVFIEDRPWYTRKDNDSNSVARNLRENLSYDWKLRNYYQTFLLVLTFGSIVIQIAYGYIFAPVFPEYLISIVLPSIPWYLLCIKELLENGASIKLTKEGADQIQEETANNKNVTEYQLRQILDLLFVHRKSAPLVPDLMYTKFRSRINSFIDALEK